MPHAVRLDGLTPSSFRLMFDKKLHVDLIKTHTKTSTLRLVKESRKWWDQLNFVFSSPERLVRAQTGCAHETIFGGCRINSLSAPAPISTFLNPLANKQLGCEGWTNQKYIDIWCGGDASAEARRIDFTYIPYSSLSDYEVSARQVSEAIANTPQTRIRHRQGSW